MLRIKQLVKVIWHKAASPPQTNGSIAFARWRQCATRVHNQTANRSVQPFLHSSPPKVLYFLYFAMGDPSPLKLLLPTFPWESRLPSNTRSLILGVSFWGEAIPWRHSRDRGSKGRCHGNQRSRSLYAVARPSVVCLSVVCNAPAPYSGACKFRKFLYGIWYRGHLYPLIRTENFMEIVPGEPLRQGS